MVIVADFTIKECFALTASGTPIECPPPTTIDTVGVFIDDMSSAMASPASTSPPTVFMMMIRPSMVLSCSIATRAGMICSYFVVLFCGGRI